MSTDLDHKTFDSNKDSCSSLADENEPDSPNPRLFKVISASDAEGISPLMLPKSKEVEDFNLDGAAPRPKGYMGVPSRLKHPYITSTDSSPQPLSIHGGTMSESMTSSDTHDRSNHKEQHQHHVHNLVNQIAGWLQQERQKQHSRRARRKVKKEDAQSNCQEVGQNDARSRRGSNSSDGSLALEKLETILKINSDGGRQSKVIGRRSSIRSQATVSLRKMRRQSTAGSSDTEQFEGDVIVPHCEAILDNSRTLSYTGGDSTSHENVSTIDRILSKDSRDDWIKFKYECLRITHTLRLKGWRQVSLEQAKEIEIERLCGALTNAVYVMTPPKDLPLPSNSSVNANVMRKRTPRKLLLRIYGPQVEHLIDREAELEILRRLARKKIGPRLLGTFVNGRFEEFLHAKTLTPEDLRTPEQSRQIAKRMRELHDGIDLLDKEKEGGPKVWRNWDKWVERAERIASFIDEQCANNTTGTSSSRGLARRGPVCGVEWPIFRQTVDKYRKWLDEEYGGRNRLKQQLVFAHNDTQYGNILRLEPPGESPLLLPANQHKQLVVIDFEYADPNVRGYEFANHFTEWCYDYRDTTFPHVCNTNRYPSLAEQQRFVRSYVQHHFIPFSATSTPILKPRRPSNAVQSNRSIPLTIEKSEETDSTTDAEVMRLLHETKLWRVACAAQWVAWGIVQANIPGLPQPDSEHISSSSSSNPHLHTRDVVPEFSHEIQEEPVEMTTPFQLQQTEPEKTATDEDEEFDYIGYAQERALFFWGDCLQLKIVDRSELPASLLKKVKIVNH